MTKDQIGIVTLPGKYNYGNRLQNYATSKIYSNLGFSPKTLQMPRRANISRETKRFIKKMMGYSMQNPEALMTSERSEAFDRFDSLISFAEIASLDDPSLLLYRFFSVGSDQVWNPNLIRYNEDWYYLSFAKPEQRIALAPSIGVDDLDRRNIRSFKKGLANFRYLSVREKRGAELIRLYSGRSATVICDPTLVLSADDWRKISDSRMNPKKPYIFTYLLGGLNNEASWVLNDIEDHESTKVVALSDRQMPGELDAGPAEFISLIDNAQHVITDSFHAAVFASILKTPLTIVHREGGKNMFSRLEQLSHMLGIEFKVFGSPSFDITRAKDHEGISEAIECERKRFMDYLEACLNA